MEKKKKTT